jgi:hypothetical protein
VAASAKPLPATLAATSITSTSAVLNGTVNANNNPVPVKFEYWLNNGYYNAYVSTPGTVSGTTSTPVSATVTGLLPGTTYQFRVNCTVPDGTYTQNAGDVLTFTTLGPASANLIDLQISAGVLTPGYFYSSQTNYSATVRNATSKVTVTPSPTDFAATVSVNNVALPPIVSGPSGPAMNSVDVGLNVGGNTINIDVTGTDGTTKKTYTIVVTRLSGIEDWRLTNFASSSNTGAAADSYDYAKHGIPNLLRYAFGLDPLKPNPRQLPQPSFDGHTLTITFTEPAGVSGITYGAEWSADLNGTTWNVVPDTGVGTMHVFRLSTDNPAGYMRLKVITQ